MTFKAHVRNGRILLDAATDLPDGAEVELAPVDDLGELDDEERHRLDEALAESDEEIGAGRVYPAEEVLAALRRR